MKSFFKFALILFLAAISGCLALPRTEQLCMLDELNEGHKDAEHFLEYQERGYEKLRDDIKQNQLERGVTKEYIRSKYYEPIYCKPAAGKETCLWRHPLKYFTSDMIYLDFDSAGNLLSWKIDSAK
jgi:hypothetical protein